MSQFQIHAAVVPRIDSKGRESRERLQMSAGGSEIGFNIQIKKRRRKKKIIMVLFFRPAMKDLVSGETRGTSDKEQSKRS